MKTPHSVLFRYSPSIVDRANKLTVNTVSEQSHKIGMREGEPLLVVMDCLLKYARAYKARFEVPLSNDSVLGPLWLDSLNGLRGLLYGDGAVAMELGRNTDSKDNGCLEELFWECMAVAEFTEKDM